MREIKFRVWDKKRKRMFIATTINASGSVSVFIDDGLYLLPAEQVELMQYTNLKDKNGKEIYDGDIIRIEPFFKKKGAKKFRRDKPYSNPISVVEWDEEEAAFDENHYVKGEFDCGGLLFEMTSEWECLEGTRRHDVTVIGNIHENPELLEGEE